MSGEGKNNESKGTQNEKAPSANENAEVHQAADGKADNKKENAAEAKNGEDNAAEMKERLLRLAAEFDNYKKRARNDIEAAKETGKVELVRDLLPVLDEFELAIMAINSSAHTGGNSSTDAEDAVVKGVEMVYSNMMDTLKKEGLEEIKADGKFDPYVHEIIMVKESNSDDGMILDVVKKGYKMNSKLIRPASVIISKKSKKDSGKGNDSGDSNSNKGDASLNG
ncbi:MAG: nucleotide exchange factor GrpE [Candidatus Marsarchaeota archaeon]|jgi:molecular chaperone GrpE|nr:nucleotide exchange factor GrpE [Candidatus Marsarchaeota archaeon]MCL5418926.1 nucleotide exchange factor GrpE [Candidatus Marsarchaeota archaeon]